MASGELPIVNITTADGVDVVDKENKIPATMSVTIPDGYETLFENPIESVSDIALTIRGRGNASWITPKKAFKLKLEQKEPLLGMPKSKHFSLIPYAGGLNFMSALGGLEAARLVGQSWASHAEPVEFVLNGEYRGLYFVVENVKIAKNRLNICEQEDDCEDPAKIPWGWLVEIDNNDDECQIVMPEDSTRTLRVTYHTPEHLSAMQTEWLTEEMTALNELVHDPDTVTSAWAERIDAASAAQYFIVRELFWDPDGYSGSIYMYRDTVGDGLWKFGPIWDVASGHYEKYSWVLQSNYHFGFHWFDSLMKSRALKEALVEQWRAFKLREQELYDFYRRVGDKCKGADEPNRARWGWYYSCKDSEAAAETYVDLTAKNMAWMDAAIKEIDGYVGGIDCVVSERVNDDRIYDLQGRPVSNPRRGIYIVKGRKVLID